MKATHRFTTIAVIAFLAATSFYLIGCNKPDQKQGDSQPAQVKQYTCSMHPEVVQDKPGDCPKCGMKLVEKK